jgi:ATP-dependent Clp protease ATP-binding subunit ClpA
MRTIKRLLTAAEAEARGAGEQLPGPEHLLLAATSLPDGTAARALQQFGVEPGQLRAAIEEAHERALAAVGIEGAAGSAGLHSSPTGAFRSTPQAQQVFQDAVALSKSATPAGLTGAHVVAAASRLEHGTVARALAALGVDRDRLREAAVTEGATG